MTGRSVIVIAGPTASGKSALALALAEQRNGVVINLDAMQTYDAFPILTAQPTDEERTRVPHVLYGFVPLEDTMTAARWRVLAIAEIERAHGEGRTPILCGGSGLYLRALLSGLAAIPAAPAALRKRANADWEQLGAEAFRARLAERDPAVVARLEPADRQRHVRAWEVWQATGTPLSVWQQVAPVGQPLPWRCTTVLLHPSRAWLRDRIATRFDGMLEAGIVAEVRRAFDRIPEGLVPGLKAHGAPELFRHFRGDLTLERARQIAIDHTRQYAKRQMTWFRHQTSPDMVVDPLSRHLIETVAQYLDKFRG